MPSLALLHLPHCTLGLAFSFSQLFYASIFSLRLASGSCRKREEEGTGEWEIKPVHKDSRPPSQENNQPVQALKHHHKNSTRSHKSKAPRENVK